MRGISYLAEKHVASQGLCSMKQVSKSVSWLVNVISPVLRSH